MSEVFLCERGQIRPADKKALREAGIVVVEVEDPSKCQFIRSSETIPADDMLWASLDALNTNTSYNGAREQREQLAKNLLSIVVKRRGKQ